MSDHDQIFSELEALGEAPLDEGERELVSGAGADQAQRQLGALPDVASMERLLYLAEDYSFDELSDIEERRAWNKVEARLAASPATPSSQRSGSGLRILLAVAAVAAAVALIPMLLPPPPSPEISPEVSALGEQAHAGLEALGMAPGEEAQRARDMATQYRRRLEDNG